jgi:hypothetical protein
LAGNASPAGVSSGAFGAYSISLSFKALSLMDPFSSQNAFAMRKG